MLLYILLSVLVSEFYTCLFYDVSCGSIIGTLVFFCLLLASVILVFITLYYINRKYQLE